MTGFDHFFNFRRQIEIVYQNIKVHLGMSLIFYKFAPLKRKSFNSNILFIIRNKIKKILKNQNKLEYLIFLLLILGGFFSDYIDFVLI